jgi:hypothetical protein
LNVTKCVGVMSCQCDTGLLKVQLKEKGERE